MTPVRKHGIAAAEAPLLRQADQAGEEVMAMGEHEITGFKLASLFAWTVSLDPRHSDGVTPGA